MKGKQNEQTNNDNIYNCRLLLNLLCVALIFLTGCDNKDEVKTLNKQFDRTGLENYEIRTHVFSSRSDMQRACAERSGKPVDLSLDECAEWAEFSPDWGCDIYVVDIQHMTDNSRFSAWGHGLAHCYYGTYHAER